MANQTRAIRCYNCKGDGHIAKKCIAKKRVKDSEWFKEKMLLAQAQEARVLLHEEQQDFLADSAIFMASLSPAGSINGDAVGPTYDSNILSENDVAHYIPPPEQNNAMILSVIEKMQRQVEKCNTVKENLQKAKDHLDKFDVCIKNRTVISGADVGN
ncbi:integrase, catalytic region, zinc finger, CCHC-type containing protein [Tanacetum coccineum]